MNAVRRRRIAQWQARRARADEAQIATRIDHRLLHPLLRQHLCRLVDGESLRHTSEIERHWAAETHAPITMQSHVAIRRILFSVSIRRLWQEAPRHRCPRDGDVEDSLARTAQSHRFRDDLTC